MKTLVIFVYPQFMMDLLDLSNQNKKWHPIMFMKSYRALKSQYVRLSWYFKTQHNLNATIQNISNVDGTHFFPNWKIIWVTIWSWFVHGAKQEIKVSVGKLLYHFLNHAKWRNLPMIGDQWQTLIMSNELIAALVSTY